MKLVTAIVRPEKLEVIKDALLSADICGMTISQVQGCGKQHGWKEFYRGTEIMLNMVPKVKLEIVVQDQEVSSLVELIASHAKTNEIGDGKIFVFPVEQAIRIRTGEIGSDAL